MNEFDSFFEGWWNEALGRLRAKPEYVDWSWDRLAALLLFMFINEMDAP